MPDDVQSLARRLKRLEARSTAGADPRVPLLATEFDMEDAVFPPKVWVRNNGAQTIANVTWTALTFDTESFDTDAMHDTVANTSRITFNTAGTYLVIAHASWAGDPVSARIAIRQSGSAYLVKIGLNDADYRNMEVSEIRPFIAGEYIEVMVVQASGGNLNTGVAAGEYSTFQAVRIAP